MNTKTVKKILLIEDNPGDIKLMKELLKEITSFEHELLVAENLKDGSELLKENNIILILLDLNLPDSSGKQTFETVIGLAQSIPIVLVSGMNDSELSLELIKNGAQDFILKQDLNNSLLGKTIQFAVLRKQLEEALKASAAELLIANKELAFQNEEKEKRAAELVIANKELAFQNEEKEKRAAELVIAKEEAEDSDRLKSAFLANMSHEIRTPMNGILGFSNLLKEPGLTGEKQQKYIEIIEKSGERMLNIIQEIIDISKIESGQMEVIYKETNINKLTESIFNLEKLPADIKGINFSLKNSLPAKETIIKTDSEKLYSILTNLIKNAIKYTDNGSIEFGFKSLGKTLEFYVKDTGIGIPLARQEAIFERFVQADIPDIQARQGAGLGLAIAKAFVEMLGGKIWVESEEGKGSTFYFTIKYNSVSESNTITKSDEQLLKEDNISGKFKVLVVDDDKVSQELISIMLENLAKEIIEAGSGLEAVETCRNNADIDLILMDIKMPDLNGYEATRQIRQFNKDVVIIAQTAYALIGDKEKAINIGCNDYITKPLNTSEMEALIKKYLNK